LELRWRLCLVPVLASRRAPHVAVREPHVVVAGEIAMVVLVMLMVAAVMAAMEVVVVVLLLSAAVVAGELAGAV
jgi:hypothetical protein